MPITRKLWGVKEHLYADGTISVDKLFIEPGGYCSKHSHKLLSNKFYIISGQLEIGIFDREKPDQLLDVIKLSTAYREVCIPPNTVHKFINNSSTEGCHVIEIAYIGNWYEESDIDRLDVGGKL